MPARADARARTHTHPPPKCHARLSFQTFGDESTGVRPRPERKTDAAPRLVSASPSSSSSCNASGLLSDSTTSQPVNYAKHRHSPNERTSPKRFSYARHTTSFNLVGRFFDAAAALNTEDRNREEAAPFSTARRSRGPGARRSVYRERATHESRAAAAFGECAAASTPPPSLFRSARPTSTASSRPFPLKGPEKKTGARVRP